MLDPTRRDMDSADIEELEAAAAILERARDVAERVEALARDREALWALVHAAEAAEEAMVVVLNLLGRRFTPGSGGRESEVLGQLDIAWMRLHTRLKKLREAEHA